MIYEAAKQGDDLRITFSGSIGMSFWEDGLTYRMIRDTIEPERAGIRSLTLEICSPGGDVLEAFAIYNYLNSLGIPVTAEVTGWAASAASYIIMAADRIKVHANSFILIHEPSVCAFGDRHDHRKAASVLDSIFRSLVDAYMTHAEASREEIEDLVTAETWLTADEAVRLGLADEILDAIPAAAAANFPINSDRFQNIPTDMKGTYPMPKKSLKKVKDEEEKKVCPDNAEQGKPAEPAEPAEPEKKPEEDPAEPEAADESESTAPDEGTPADADDGSVTDLAEQISALMDEVKDLRGALQAAKDAEADAKKQLDHLRAQIDRLTAGVKHSAKPADTADTEKDWETLMKEGDGSPAHYMNMRRLHPEAFKAYLAKFNS